ncbi:coiled-coil domain-containing protein 172-like [Polymixia lowei]
MSLDALFQHILLTEQQLSEKTKKFQEVKVSIIRCQEKIKASNDKCEKTKQELDKKAQQLSEMRLQHDLMKKHEGQMEKQIDELLCQQSHLKEHLDKIKRESKEEEKRFLNELVTFNSDFSLRGNRGTVLEDQMQSETVVLEKEVESLYEGIELMSQKNGRLHSMLEEKRVLQLELKGLDNTRKDLDRQLSEAEEMTESLRAESLMVSQKPLTDSTCLRLRKELETHKEGELERLREALSSEILFLQSVST